MRTNIPVVFVEIEAKYSKMIQLTNMFINCNNVHSANLFSAIAVQNTVLYVSTNAIRSSARVFPHRTEKQAGLNNEEIIEFQVN